jgi:hypothetical protein
VYTTRLASQLCTSNLVVVGAIDITNKRWQHSSQNLEGTKRARTVNLGTGRIKVHSEPPSHGSYYVIIELGRDQ